METPTLALTWQLELWLCQLLRADLQDTCTYRAIVELWQEQTKAVWSQESPKIYRHFQEGNAKTK